LFLILLLSAIRYPLTATYAAVPRLINYQGRLTDADNKPLEGSHNLTFRIYDAETAGNLLWEEAHPSLLIQKGIFSILLGSVTSLGLAFDKPYWLEIKVADEVMSPRQQITSSAYAIRAEKAEDANTVANVGVSTTPVPNKLLPLDNTAKLPLSALALKVYDSGWFAVAASTTYIKTHNLGTTKVLVITYLAENSDGSGWCVHNMGQATPDSRYHCMMVALSTTTITIRAAQFIASFYDKDGTQISTPTSGYARIIMCALEG
ncbi:MAG: hypothetical protein V1925_00150, partial [Candidatus Omnitrophota bacterium]